MANKVPFNDLYAQYLNIKLEIDTVITEVIRQSAYIKGTFVEEFEKNFAEALSISQCIGCANGTDSLEIALRALGISAGDEVIIPACTWISTSEAVTSVGAFPVFVDVDPDYYTISTSEIEKKITSRTKAIIPVHFYGQAAEMDAIMTIAKKHNLFILEDCAQAHLALYKGRPVGTIGDIGSFSFFPGKNLGAYGDAGGIVTNDRTIAEYCRKYGNHGRIGKHDHEFEGRNSRLDALQAAILNVKLPYLKEWTFRRREIAKMYSELLLSSNIKLPAVAPYSTHVYHLYVIQLDDRNRIQAGLHQNGIQTGIHYPISLPFTQAYAHLEAKPSDFPVAHDIMDRILSLPIYPEMSNEQVEYVCRTLKDLL